MEVVLLEKIIEDCRSYDLLEKGNKI